MFINDDEFGVDDYRNSFSYVCSANAVKVELLKKSTNEEKLNQGDFLGIKSNIGSPKPKQIKINVMSDNPEENSLEEAGYDGKGKIKYSCFCEYDVDVSNKDLIRFVDGFGYNIKKGQVFQITINDEGLFQGQYCYKHFTIVMI